jgi:hypothetical protein
MGGMGGVTGFDYSALPFLFEVHGVDKSEWAEYLDKICVLSEVALKYFNKRDDKKDTERK